MLQFQLSVYGFFELRRRRTDRQTRDICSTGSDVCSCGLAAGTAIADAAQNLKRKKIFIKTLTTIRTCTRDKGVRTVGMGLFRKPPPFCERIIRDGRAGGHALQHQRGSFSVRCVSFPMSTGNSNAVGGAVHAVRSGVVDGRLSSISTPSPDGARNIAVDFVRVAIHS